LVIREQLAIIEQLVIIEQLAIRELLVINRLLVINILVVIKDKFIRLVVHNVVEHKVIVKQLKEQQLVELKFIHK